MADVLFTTTCTTCEVRLNVRDKSAIGQIVTCPKCGSMVQIVLPPGWQLPPESPQPETPETVKRAVPAEEPSPVTSDRLAAKQENLPAPPPASNAPQAESVDPALSAAEPPIQTTQAAEAKPERSPARRIAGAVGTAAAATPVLSATGSDPPAVAPNLGSQPSPAEVPVIEVPPVQPQPVLPPESLPGPLVGPWVSPVEAAMRRWLWWSAIPAAGLVVVFGVWAILWGGKDPPSKPNENSTLPALETGLPQVPAPILPEYDDRWLPDRPEFVLSLDIANGNAAGQLAALFKTAPPLERAIMEELFPGFGLKPNAVERLDWASSDLSEWSQKGIVVITLAQGQNAGHMRAAGTPLKNVAAEIELRQLDRPTWKRAFAILDERTIVTGEETLLRKLTQRGDEAADLGLLRPLLAVAPGDADFFLALDLHAAAQAGWPSPGDWLDVWPEGRDTWRLIWSLPTALSFNFDRADLALAELGLLCDGDTVAEKVRVAVDQWIPQAKTVLSARLDSLESSAQAGEISAAAVGPYRAALNGASAALASAHVEVASRCVWLRVDCGNNSPAWTAAAADSRGAIDADWYRAAGVIDGKLQGGMYGALSGYEQAKQKAPAGAISSGPLPPEKVLSWITAMLPYLGHEAWAEDLNTSYSWDSPKNRPVTSRTLDAVQNPAVADRATPSGFPVTHYVGVAGIGADAADLPRTDPRAGVFGHRESRRLTDVPDGASNTIATVGVSGKLGSWASGGSATVRGFAEKPYINGPDGFGSGQPGGMYAGMADGSARFLSAKIDPTVLEQLATAAGGEPPVARPTAGDVVRVEPAPATEAATDEVVRVDPKSPSPAKMDPPIPEEPPIPAPAPPGRAAAVAEPVPSPAADTTETAAEETAEQTTIDIAQRLQMPLLGIAITDVPLQQAIQSIEDLGSLTVTFDLDTMSALGILLDRPVNMRVTKTTVGQALDSVLASCGLKPVVRDNQLWVTGAGQASDASRAVRYSVTDLVSAGGPPAAELATWISRLIAPETWEAHGGQGKIHENAGVLEITQSEPVHLEILVFCERLRVARGLSPRSGRPAESFGLATRRARAAECLRQPVTLNFFQPTAIRRVLQEVDQACEARIGVNWLALAEEQKLPSLPAVLTVSQAPLESALGQMLDPLGLDFRASAERTIEVTTRAAADAHFEREFYPIGDLLDAGQNAAALIDRLRGEIAAGTWESDGGKGVVILDETSRCLIVLQTQRAQVAIEAFLTGLRPQPAADRAN